MSITLSLLTEWKQHKDCSCDAMTLSLLTEWKQHKDCSCNVNDTESAN